MTQNDCAHETIKTLLLSGNAAIVLIVYYHHLHHVHSLLTCGRSIIVSFVS